MSSRRDSRSGTLTNPLHYRLFIDGTWTDVDAKSVVDVVNPATEVVSGTAMQATASHEVRLFMS